MCLCMDFVHLFVIPPHPGLSQPIGYYYYSSPLIITTTVTAVSVLYLLYDTWYIRVFSYIGFVNLRILCMICIYICTYIYIIILDFTK